MPREQLQTIHDAFTRNQSGALGVGPPGFRILVWGSIGYGKSYMLAAESAFLLRHFRQPSAVPNWHLIYLPTLGTQLTGVGPSDFRKALLVAWAHNAACLAELDTMEGASLAALMSWVRARVSFPFNERVYLILDQYSSSPRRRTTASWSTRLPSGGPFA